MHNISIKKIPDAGGSPGVNSANAAGNKSRVELIKEKVNQFVTRNGRRPRVLVSHIGPSGQRRALNQVAALFAHRGFDVDIGPIGQAFHQVALMAIENDVHMVCLLCDPDQQSQVGSDLIDVLRTHNSSDILVAFFCGKYTGKNLPNGRFDPVRFRLDAADTDIIFILDKLTQKN